MTLPKPATALLFALSILLLATPVNAQTCPFDGWLVPRESPPTSVAQTAGVTEITVKYNRPAVKGRAIWGGLVPYDKVWRAGANEATTITFSTDVKIEGQTLRAGTYGLFMLPTQAECTVIFSHADRRETAERQAMRVVATHGSNVHECGGAVDANRGRGALARQTHSLPQLQALRRF